MQSAPGHELPGQHQSHRALHRRGVAAQRPLPPVAGHARGPDHVRRPAPADGGERRARRALVGAVSVGRHLAIDAVLERAIERHGISQVVEVAAGMSPRGWRLANRYGDRLTYGEAALPAMADRKWRALRRIGSLSDAHRVREVDVLQKQDLAALADELDP